MNGPDPYKVLDQAREDFGYDGSDINEYCDHLEEDCNMSPEEAEATLTEWVKGQ